MRYRFGGDARASLVWSREMVRNARTLPCEIVIQALSPGEQQSVYRITWFKGGRYQEEELAR